MALGGQAGIWRKNPRHAEELATRGGRGRSGVTGRANSAGWRTWHEYGARALLAALTFERTADMKRFAALLLALLFAPSALAQPADWQKVWDETLAAAKNEGKVVIIGSPDP